MTALMSSIDPLYRIPLSCLLTMPRFQVDFNAFRDEIERRIASEHTHRQIRSWLVG
jgi:hypothetical protein